ncbi:aldehyde reductase 2 [Apiospora arundinis]
MGRDPPTKGSHRPHRLPVNQRRHKVAPENRKRVSTACNSCNVRRIKCTGEHPCQPCRSSSRECQYPETVEKISVPRPEWDNLVAKCARLERCLEYAVPDVTQRQHLMSHVSASSSPCEPDVSQSSHHQSDIASPSRGNAPGGSSSPREDMCIIPSSEGGPARHLGPTSAAAFLSQVQEFMTNAFTLSWSSDCPPDTTELLGSVGRYQTQHMQPCRSLQPAVLPPMDELNTMLTELKYFIQDVRDDSSFGGMFHWGNLNPSMLDFDSLDTLPDSPQSCRKLAFIHAALAASCVLDSPLATKNDVHKGDAFFERARFLMGSPLDTIRCSLNDLPLLAMLAIYLVEVNTTDAAFAHVSFGMHIAIMHGAHQGCVGDEYEKRSFWTLYVLDRWLSASMGRPPTLMDEAIHLTLPVDAHGLPKPTGLVAHVKLAKIAGHIVRNAYQASSRDNDAPTDASYVETTLRMLQKWSATLPAELRLANFHVGFSRAAGELRMEHNQLVILTTRPTFLEIVKKAVAARIDHRTWHWQNSPQCSHVWPCLDAARENMRLAQRIRSLASSRKLPAPALRNIFDATVIVLLHELLTGPANTDEDASDILFAVGCLDAEAESRRNGGSDSSFPRGCARVLRDLRTLVRRLVDHGLGGGLALAAASTLRTDPTVPKRGMPASQPPTTAIYDVGFILNPEIPPEAPGPAPAHASATASSHALFTELSSWMSSEENRLYDGYPTI